MSRIALFGGSFNPIHNGHLHLAQTVHQQCGLDRMLLPTGLSCAGWQRSLIPGWRSAIMS